MRVNILPREYDLRYFYFLNVHGLTIELMFSSVLTVKVISSKTINKLTSSLHDIVQIPNIWINSVHIIKHSIKQKLR